MWTTYYKFFNLLFWVSCTVNDIFAALLDEVNRFPRQRTRLFFSEPFTWDTYHLPKNYNDLDRMSSHIHSNLFSTSPTYHYFSRIWIDNGTVTSCMTTNVYFSLSRNDSPILFGLHRYMSSAHYIERKIMLKINYFLISEPSKWFCSCTMRFNKFGSILDINFNKFLNWKKINQ